MMLSSFAIYYDAGLRIYLVRRFVIVGGLDPLPREIVGRAASLEGARALVPAGLACFGRDVSDAPEIVETWL